ncbi:MAG TPA: ABC transporter ATP-binding protein [Actinocrinis sp.]|nr:ABC transporter ATP-binding protein [Actinocrinis sp.]
MTATEDSGQPAPAEPADPPDSSDPPDPGSQTPAETDPAPPPAAADDWRGVAAEKVDEVSAQAGFFLRARSRRLLISLLRPHRRALGWATVLIVVVTGAEMAGPYLVSVGIDTGIPALGRRDWAPVLWTVGGILATALLGAVLRLFFLNLVGRIGQDLLLDLRRRVFAQFQRLPVAFHEQYTSGRVISRLTNDLDALADLIDNSLDGLINAVLNVIVISILLVLLDPLLSLALAAVLPALLGLLVWYTRGSRVAYRRTREAVAALIVQFVETLNGIRAVQAFRREPRNEVIFERLNQDYRDANADAQRLLALFMPGIKAVGAVITAAVLLFGGFQVLDGALQVGVLTAFLLYLRQFFDPLQDLAMFYTSYQSATAALEKLSGVLEQEPDVPEPAEPATLPDPVRGEISFAAVAFAYPARDSDTAPDGASGAGGDAGAGADGATPARPASAKADKVILPGLDLVIPAGQTVALVGSTGAGKSTVARLMCRFYDPVAGRVGLDGIDLRDLADADLRAHVVMVTQENFLFTGTVADNIRFGRPDATDEEVRRAAEEIGAHEFIAHLPEGYATDVKKRGGRLSAGQRQLIAFARAFLADPAVLVLDEATSSLDVPSERLVQRALRTILADRTALIIAHRLSTVEIADRVLVMEDGRIVEDGSPEELLAIESARVSRTGGRSAADTDGEPGDAADDTAPEQSGRFAALHSAWRDSLASV